MRFTDQFSKEHRIRVGPKKTALKVYRQKKTEAAEGRFFPEDLHRREALLADVIDDSLARVKGTLLSYRDCERYGEMWKKTLPGRALRQVTPGDVERFRQRRADGAALQARRSQKSTDERDGTRCAPLSP